MSGAPYSGTYVALSGGVGGAKLALGLSRLLGPALSVVVNTGDDFDHLGLRICPDIDSVLYKLAGLSDEQRGWGRAGETWNFMQALAGLGGESWFQLGDKDLALHVERTRLLRQGETLTEVTAHVARQLGVASHILPMSDDPVSTEIDSSEGRLPFQRYFVEHQCRPVLHGLHYAGARVARLSDAVARALQAPDLRGIIICPSNPYLSIDPILAMPAFLKALQAADVPVVAVSPIIANAAVKGPTAKIMRELGVTPSSLTVAQHYRGLIDGLVIDSSDHAESDAISLPVLQTPTLMKTAEDSERVARAALEFCARLAGEAWEVAP